MAKNSLLNKIVEMLKITESYQGESVSKTTNFKFCIPDSEVLMALNNGGKLSIYQIREVLNYIANNYYLEEGNYDVLVQFAGEWTRCMGDVDTIQNRKEVAIDNLIKNLSAGDGINPLDALWLSDRIYADSGIVNRRRIISKVIEQGVAILNVKSALQNSNVVREIDELEAQLRDRKFGLSK